MKKIASDERRVMCARCGIFGSHTNAPMTAPANDCAPLKMNPNLYSPIVLEQSVRVSESIHSVTKMAVSVSVPVEKRSKTEA
jgi:hypothetical protein